MNETNYEIKKLFNSLECFKIVFLPTIIFFILGTFYITDQISLVFATECVSKDPKDKDGDGIPNNIETNGIDINADKTIDLYLDLSDKKANPDHKDLFLEIDYMEHHIPIDAVIPNVINAFAKAPVCNPDKRPGITLHVQLGEEIPHIDSINLIEKDNQTGNKTRTWYGFNDLKDEYFGTSQERNDPNHENIINAKKLIYHYTILGHFFDKEEYSRVSGISDSLTGNGGMDFIVSLGSFTLNSDIDPQHNTGNTDEQEGTLMHEFGHNLGLGHGGIDDINCKPNYISVMNYIRQFSWFDTNRELNYSPITLDPLDESNLNESKGVTPLINSSIFYTPTAYKKHNPPNVPIDWNGKNGVKDTKLTYNINQIKEMGDSCKDSYNILFGNNDWNNLIYLTSTINAHVTDILGLSIDMNNGFSLPETKSSQNNVNNSLLSKHDSLLDKELSYDVIQNINIDRLSALNHKIEKISENTTAINPSAISEYLGFTNTTNRESALDEGTSLESPKTIDYLEAGNIDSAISSLDFLSSKLEEKSAESAMSEDESSIDDSNELRKVSDLIKNTTELFKSQSCQYTDCSIVEKDPDMPINY